jgi:hypothetical protein
MIELFVLYSHVLLYVWTEMKNKFICCLMLIVLLWSRTEFLRERTGKREEKGYVCVCVCVSEREREREREFLSRYAFRLVCLINLISRQEKRMWPVNLFGCTYLYISFAIVYILLLVHFLVSLKNVCLNQVSSVFVRLEYISIGTNIVNLGYYSSETVTLSWCFVDLDFSGALDEIMWCVFSGNVIRIYA